MLRFLSVVALFIIIFSFQKAHACSCWCPYGQTVSDYMQGRVVFWGIPKNSKVTQSNTGERSGFYITSDIIVLESYSQKLPKNISIKSSPEDGGTCGFQPRVGIPQLITAFPNKEGYSGFSECTCEIPTKSLFDYLENGKDSFIPDPRKCEEDTKDERCGIWKNAEEYDDLLWSKTIEFFPYSKHSKKLFDDR